MSGATVPELAEPTTQTPNSKAARLLVRGRAKHLTMLAPLDVPELVHQRARSNGAAGRQWLRDLPELVVDLANRWGLEMGRSFRGGTAAFVAAARDQSGRACVLKVLMPLGQEAADDFSRSVLVHRLAAGRGCAELLEHDESTQAMLIERLGPNLDDLEMPLHQVLETIATTLRSFWRPVPDNRGLPTGVEKASWHVEYITRSWAGLGRPCAREVIDRAVSYCDERAVAFDPSRAVLVHGDAHGWNTLDAGGGAFKFVDPEGLRSERAHDLSVPMREYNQPLLVGDTGHMVPQRAEALASWCGVDPEPVWQWGFIERVSSGLANLRGFDGDEGLTFLEVATRCL